MRIPPSAIVMTLVVSVPFGLAIRDSLKGNDRQSKQDRELEEARQYEEKARADQLAEEKREADAEKARDEHRKQTFASLLGTTRGMLGTRLGAQIGDVPPDGFENTLDSLEDLEFSDGVTPGNQLRGDGKLTSVSLPVGDAHCGDMRNALEHAWGTAADDIWIDTDHSRRASLGGLLCVLHFDQFVDDAAWAKTALPKILDKTPEQAQKLLGTPTVPLDNDVLSWFEPGAQHGRDSTEIIATRDGAKIYRTEVSTTVTAEQATALIAALTKQLGKSPETSDMGTVYTWDKANVNATYNTESWRFTVSHEVFHRGEE
jgi:hypothetical protein